MGSASRTLQNSLDDTRKNAKRNQPSTAVSSALILLLSGENSKDSGLEGEAIQLDSRPF
jgi:hypothetical protein